MTLYAATSSEISPLIIVGLGVVAFGSSTLEILIDMTIPRHKIEHPWTLTSKYLEARKLLYWISRIYVCNGWHLCQSIFIASIMSPAFPWHFFSLIASQSPYIVIRHSSRAYSPLLNLFSPLMGLFRFLGQLVLALRRFTTRLYRFHSCLCHFRLHPLLLLSRQSSFRFLEHSIEDWILPRNKCRDLLVDSWYPWWLCFFMFGFDDERRCRLSPYISCSYWMSSIA